MRVLIDDFPKGTIIAPKEGRKSSREINLRYLISAQVVSAKTTYGKLELTCIAVEGYAKDYWTASFNSSNKKTFVVYSDAFELTEPVDADYELF